MLIFANWKLIVFLSFSSLCAVSIEDDVAVRTALFYYVRHIHYLGQCIYHDETISSVLVVTLQLPRMCCRQCQYDSVHISVMIKLFCPR